MPCYDNALFKACVAVVLLSGLLGSIVTTFLSPAGAGCTEEACRCAHHRDSKPSPAPPCHESASAAERDCEMRGTCAHESPLIVTPRPFLVPQVSQAAVSPTAEILDPPQDGFPQTGVLRIDSPPPRTS